MRFNKLLLISAILAVAAFGLYGLNELVNSKIDPVQASAPTGDKPGSLTLVNTAGGSDGQTVSAIEIVPAPEIPARPPDAGGIFSAREGDTLTLQSFMVTTSGAQGFIVSGSAVMAGGGEGFPEAGVVTSFGTASIIAPGSQGGQFESGSGTVELQAGAIPAQGELVQSGPPSAMPDGAVTTFTIGPGLPAQASPQKIMLTDATKIYHDVTSLPRQPEAGTHTIQQVLEAGSLDGLTSQQVMVTVWGHKDGEQLVADMIVYQEPPALP